MGRICKTVYATLKIVWLILIIIILITKNNGIMKYDIMIDTSQFYDLYQQRNPNIINYLNGAGINTKTNLQLPFYSEHIAHDVRFNILISKKVMDYYIKINSKLN